MRSFASHAGRRSPDDFMLTAGGRAPPFGDLAKCATAAGADAGTSVQLADFFAWGRRAWDHRLSQPFTLRYRKVAVRHLDKRAQNWHVGGSTNTRRNTVQRYLRKHHKAPPGRCRAGRRRGGQLPFEVRARDQIRLWVLPSSSANRLAKIGALKLGSSSLIER